MSITESEMRAIREMFLDAAGSILESERKILGEMVKGIENRLDDIDQRIADLTKFQELEKRLERLEILTGFPAAKQ